MNSEVEPITLEARGLKLYEFGSRYKYFVINEKLDRSKALWYLEALDVLDEQKDPLGLFEFVAGIILPDVEETHEGRKIL